MAREKSPERLRAERWLLPALPWSRAQRIRHGKEQLTEKEVQWAMRTLRAKRKLLTDG